jgi:hypothetical protein
MLRIIVMLRVPISKGIKARGRKKRLRSDFSEKIKKGINRRKKLARKLRKLSITCAPRTIQGFILNDRRSCP